MKEFCRVLSPAATLSIAAEHSSLPKESEVLDEPRGASRTARKHDACSQPADLEAFSPLDFASLTPPQATAKGSAITPRTPSSYPRVLLGSPPQVTREEPSTQEGSSGSPSVDQQGPSRLLPAPFSPRLALPHIAQRTRTEQPSMSTPTSPTSLRRRSHLPSSALASPLVPERTGQASGSTPAAAAAQEQEREREDTEQRRRRDMAEAVAAAVGGEDSVRTVSAREATGGGARAGVMRERGGAGGVAQAWRQGDSVLVCSRER